MSGDRTGAGRGLNNYRCIKVRLDSCFGRIRSSESMTRVSSSGDFLCIGQTETHILATQVPVRSLDISILSGQDQAHFDNLL
jgi:hypothetical protein